MIKKLFILMALVFASCADDVPKEDYETSSVSGETENVFMIRCFTPAGELYFEGITHIESYAMAGGYARYTFPDRKVWTNFPCAIECRTCVKKE